MWKCFRPLRVRSASVDSGCAKESSTLWPRATGSSRKAVPFSASKNESDSAHRPKSGDGQKPPSASPTPESGLHSNGFAAEPLSSIRLERSISAEHVGRRHGTPKREPARSFSGQPEGPSSTVE